MYGCLSPWFGVDVQDFDFVVSVACFGAQRSVGLCSMNESRQIRIHCASMHSRFPRSLYQYLASRKMHGRIVDMCSYCMVISTAALLSHGRFHCHWHWVLCGTAWVPGTTSSVSLALKRSATGD